MCWNFDSKNADKLYILRKATDELSKQTWQLLAEEIGGSEVKGMFALYLAQFSAFL